MADHARDRADVIAVSTLDAVAGLIIVILLLVYLVYALLKPEKF